MDSDDDFMPVKPRLGKQMSKQLPSNRKTMTKLQTACTDNKKTFICVECGKKYSSQTNLNDLTRPQNVSFLHLLVEFAAK